MRHAKAGGRPHSRASVDVRPFRPRLAQPEGHLTICLSRSCRLLRTRHVDEPALTDDFAQVVENWLGFKASCCEANVAVRAYQNQRVASDTIGAGSMSIAIDQGLVGGYDWMIRARDRVDT